MLLIFFVIILHYHISVDIHLLSKKVAVKSDHQDMNREEVLEMQEEI